MMTKANKTKPKKIKATTTSTKRQPRKSVWAKVGYFSMLQLLILGVVIFMFGMQIKLLPRHDNHHNTRSSSSSSSNKNHKKGTADQIEQKLQEDTTTLTKVTNDKINHRTTATISASAANKNEMEPQTTTTTTSSLSSISSLPTWMQEYFHWHATQRQTVLTSPIWKKYQPQKNNHNTTITTPKLLILTCTEQNVKCGGISDRLKPLPLLLLGAYQTQRILLIRWKNRPAKLETFMTPPPLPPPISDTSARLDWTVPEWLDSILDDAIQQQPRKKHIINVKPFMKQLQSSPNVPIVTATLQWWDGGEQAYKDALELDKDNDEFRRIYHDLFRCFFRPTPPIQQLLNQIYQSTPLKPNHYAVAHYRALWWEQQDPPSLQEQDETAKNAVYCASQLIHENYKNDDDDNNDKIINNNNNNNNKNIPIYFATDSKDAQQSILEYSQSIATTTATATATSTTTTTHHYHPIIIIPHSELVHLDRVPDGTPLQDIYPLFVDLWLLANSKCISYGDGGFGKYGLMLSGNYTCGYRHIFRHKLQRCENKLLN